VEPPPTPQGLNQSAVPGTKLIKLEPTWIAVWILFQVAPAGRVAVSLLETVISQFACWVAEGPQAGKFTVLMATPVTAVKEEPKPPPKFTAPITVFAGLALTLVSSTQNLMVIWFRFKAVVPLLMTSKFCWVWLAPQVVNSLSCRPTGLVPQAAPIGVAVAVGPKGVLVPVGVGVGVRVAVAVNVVVEVRVKLLVAVAVAVAVTEGNNWIKPKWAEKLELCCVPMVSYDRESSKT
jgi:hypothetical protein